MPSAEEGALTNAILFAIISEKGEGILGEDERGRSDGATL